MPNMKFIVSGQPKLGHESWPANDDRTLSDRLYAQRGAEEDTRMEVRFEKVGDRLITYYHFSKLKNITSGLTDDEKRRGYHKDHGRPGSFFVMSLRLDDVYSTDFNGIYHTLEKLYDDYVNEKILKRSKEGFLVYQILILEEASGIWEEMSDKITRLCSKAFLNNGTLKRIPDGTTIKGGKGHEYFSVASNTGDIEDALLRDGKIMFLSSEENALREQRIADAQPKVIGTPTEHLETGGISSNGTKNSASATTGKMISPTSDMDDSQKIGHLLQSFEKHARQIKVLEDKIDPLSESQSAVSNEKNYMPWFIIIILLQLILIVLILLIPKAPQDTNNILPPIISNPTDTIPKDIIYRTDTATIVPVAITGSEQTVVNYRR